MLGRQPIVDQQHARAGRRGDVEGEPPMGVDRADRVAAAMQVEHRAARHRRPAPPPIRPARRRHRPSRTWRPARRPGTRPSSRSGRATSMTSWVSGAGRERSRVIEAVELRNGHCFLRPSVSHERCGPATAALAFAFSGLRHDNDFIRDLEEISPYGYGGRIDSSRSGREAVWRRQWRAGHRAAQRRAACRRGGQRRRAVGLRQEHPAAPDRRPRCADPRHHPHRRQTGDRPGARHRHRLPARPAARMAQRARQRPAAGRDQAAGGPRIRAPASCCRSSMSRASPSPIPGSCRAACASAWRSPAPC